MKITFISNFLNHHQIPLCESFLAIPGVEFTFIATGKVPKARIAMGYKQEANQLPYCREAIGPRNVAAAEQLCFDSDVVIIGSAPITYVKRRLKARKLTFSYNERWFRAGFWRHPGDIYRALRDFTRYNNRNFYQLCASAYTAGDSKRVLAFPGRKLRWGYFPEVKTYDIQALMDGKEPATLLWVARFLKLKHPEKAIEVARRLKEEGIYCRLSFIGSGELEPHMLRMIFEYGLEDRVFLLGTMSPEEVRVHMERSALFLFTSDFGEGWGAVLNEAMNSGCAVVSSHAAGAAPYLLESGQNGMIYQNENDEQLYRYVKQLLTDDALRRQLGTEAYRTMADLWNSDLAARRLYDFAKAKLEGKQLPVYKEGPMSYDCGKLRNNRGTRAKI